MYSQMIVCVCMCLGSMFVEMMARRNDENADSK